MAAFIVVDKKFPRSMRWSSKLQYQLLVPLLRNSILRKHCWVSVDVSRQIPAAGWNTTLIQFLITRTVWITRISWVIFLRTQEVLWHQNSLVSVSPLLNLLWKYFPEHSWTMTLCFLLERKGQQENIEKFMIFNKRRRWSHSSRVKFLSVNMSASWFLVSTYLIWFDRTTNQEQLCEFLTCASSLYFCTWWSFRSLLHCPQRCTTETHLEKNLRLWCSLHATIDRHLGFSFAWVWICDFANSFLLRGWLVFRFCSMNVPLLSPHPTNQEQEVHPFAIQHPEKWSQTLWSCAKQKFVSCTSNWVGHKFCFPKYTRHHLRLISSPRSRHQSLSLGIDPINKCWAVLPTWH